MGAWDTHKVLNLPNYVVLLPSHLYTISCYIAAHVNDASAAHRVLE